MKTLVIKIASLDNYTNTYLAELFLEEGNNNWLETPRGSSSIPADLSINNPPLDPITKKAMNIKEARKIILTDSNSSARFRAIGDYLFRLLSQGTLDKAWADARAKYPYEGKGSEGLRTVLDIGPPELQALPWELLLDNKNFLFADPTNPFVRGNIEYGQIVDSYILPVCALVIVGCEENDKVINWQEEVEGIEDAFRAMRRSVECDVMLRPSREELINYLEKSPPHILHFIGHGRQSEDEDDVEQGKSFFLEVYDKDSEEAWKWTADDIIMDMPSANVPRFVFINACRSGDNKEANSWGIAEAFLTAGVPAVLGMLADVRTDVAGTIAKSLYQSFSEKKPLDIALAQARKDVSKIKDIGWNSREWSLASLSLAVQPEHVLPLKQCVDDPQQLKSIEDKFESVRYFVNRSDQRRELWRKVDPNEGDYQDLLVIEGDDEVGKSALKNWCLEGCALRGRRIVNVDAGKEVYNFVDIMRFIREDLSLASPLHQPLKADAFLEFNRRLNFLLEGIHPVPAVGGSILDEGKPWTSGDSKIVNDIFGSFRDALRQAAGDAPLIIALDHLKLLDGHFENYLWPNLINFIRRRALPQVRMLLIFSSSDVKKYKKSIENFVHETIEVQAFEAKEFVRLAREFCRYSDINNLNETIEVIAKGIKSNWKPDQFNNLRGISKIMA